MNKIHVCNGSWKKFVRSYMHMNSKRRWEGWIKWVTFPGRSANLDFRHKLNVRPFRGKFSEISFALHLLCTLADSCTCTSEEPESVKLCRKGLFLSLGHISYFCLIVACNFWKSRLDAIRQNLHHTGNSNWQNCNCCSKTKKVWGINTYKHRSWRLLQAVSLARNRK